MSPPAAAAPRRPTTASSPSRGLGHQPLSEGDRRVPDPTARYEEIRARLADEGVDVDAVERSLRELVIETPSWGYGDSGTRFAVFPQPGRPRDVFERVEDAAEVHRLTGTAGAVALHLPLGTLAGPDELRAHNQSYWARRGAV